MPSSASSTNRKLRRIAVWATTSRTVIARSAEGVDASPAWDAKPRAAIG
jgi:hypothetical protein